MGGANKRTLHDFVEDNHKLLTSLGVFTALTAFATRLEPAPWGLVLSFFFLAATVLLWFELLGRFPAERGSERLLWFENSLGFATLTLVAYWLVEYRLVWRQYLIMPVMLILAASGSHLLRRYDLFNRIFRARPGRKRVLRYVFALAFALACAGVAWPVAAIANRALDAVYLRIRQSQEMFKLGVGSSEDSPRDGR